MGVTGRVAKVQFMRTCMCAVFQAKMAQELEQHRVRLLSVFDNLHSRIMDAKTLAAAACKPVSQQDKVSA